jgi:hypothetical protein
MITLKGKSYRLRERGHDVAPAAQDRRLQLQSRISGALFDCANWRTLRLRLTR